MERMIRINTIPGTKPIQTVPANQEPAMEIHIPGRGATGMVRMGSIVEQIRQIINHPDRNRLMAELFKDYKRDYK